MESQELPPESDGQKAERLLRQAEVDDFQKRKSLGADGKLWCVEVMYRRGMVSYDDDDAGTPSTRRKKVVLYSQDPNRLLIKNLTGGECMRFRESIFSAGLKVQIDPGRYKIIPPWDLLDIEIQRQNQYFDV